MRRFLSSQPAPNRLFGYAIDLDGDTPVVGEPGWIFQPDDQIGAVEIDPPEAKPPPDNGDTTMPITREDLDSAEARIHDQVTTEFNTLRDKLDDDPPPPPPPDTWPWYDDLGDNPFVIDFPSGFRADPQLRGGILVADVGGTGRPAGGYIVTSPHGGIAAFDWDGTLAWRRSRGPRLREGASGGSNYPGTCHPGVTATDDTLIFVEDDQRIFVLDLHDGDVIRSLRAPGGTQFVTIAYLDGGDDALLICQQDKRSLVAINTDGNIVWSNNEYLGFDHSPVFCADIDGDGDDEILGVLSVDARGGQRLHGPGLYPDGTALGSVDSVAFADVDDDGRTEMLLAEQGGHNATLCIRPATGEFVWENRARPAEPIGDCSREVDPDKLVAANFVPARAGLEVLARSACGRCPWIIDGITGQTIRHIDLDTALPNWWFRGPDTPDGDRTEGGIDVVSALDWHGVENRFNLLLFKERHVEGATGCLGIPQEKFVLGLRGREAIFTFAADVDGDGRESIIGLERRRLWVQFRGPIDREFIPHHRLWEDPVYRARKRGNHNYYSLA